MNPKERLLSTMRGEKADRVPLSIGFNHPRRGIQRITDPRRREIAERIADETEYQVGVASHINRYLVTPPQRLRAVKHENLPNGHRRTWGAIDTPKGELTYLTEHDPDSGTAWTIKYPVEDRDDIEKIASVPWERPENLAPPNLENLPDDFSERGVVRTGVSSPFVCVAGMMEYERFLELCGMDMDLVKELTDICTRRILDCMEVLFSKPGIEYVWVGGSEWVTPPMGSPEIYDELVQEQERAIIEYSHKHGAVVHIHCHGNVRYAIPRVIERGAEFTEPVEPPPDGDITMAEAKELAAGQLTLGGNVEARVLYNESEDTVEKAVRAAFEGGKERFVLGTSAGPSPAFTEREYRNYIRMIDIWEELSPI